MHTALYKLYIHILCMFYYFIELSSLEYGTIDRLLHTLNEFELLNFTITLLICETSQYGH